MLDNCMPPEVEAIPFGVSASQCGRYVEGGSQKDTQEGAPMSNKLEWKKKWP